MAASDSCPTHAERSRCIAKPTDLDAAASIRLVLSRDEQIGRFHISMHAPVLVQECQSGQHLLHDALEHARVSGTLARVGRASRSGLCRAHTVRLDDLRQVMLGVLVHQVDFVLLGTSEHAL